MTQDGLLERRAEIEAELAAALAERPALFANSEAKREAHETSEHQWQNFQLSIARGTRHGADAVMPAVLQLIADERGRRNAAAAAATLARGLLANCDWAIACRRAELVQLDLVANPPAAEHRPPEVVKRPAPPGLGDFDPIVFPPRPQARAVATTAEEAA